MKKLMLGMIALIMSANTFAQETSKTKEVGIVFSNFDYFGITYRTGTNKSLWRFQSLYLNNNNSNFLSDSLDQKSKTNGFNISIGKEFRSQLTDKINFRYGVDISFGYSQNSQTYDDKTITNRDDVRSSKIYSPGLQFVLGLNYLVNEKVLIGAELLPGITYNFGQSSEFDYYSGTTIEFDSTEFIYGFNNYAARLSIIYRF